MIKCIYDDDVYEKCEKHTHFAYALDICIFHGKMIIFFFVSSLLIPNPARKLHKFSKFQPA